MGINIFSPVKKIKKREKDKDSFDTLIEVIERFAPRDHLSEREVYYYNYRIMDAYRQPLLDLLEIASQVDRYRRDPDGHSRRLFIRLKAFYDVKGRLSLEEAVQEAALIRRFRDLLIYFYGKRDLSGQDIQGILKHIQPL